MELERLAKQNNITTLVTLGEIYQCDQLVLKYYTNPVLNVIHNKLGHIGKKTSKHFTIQYWTTIIETTFNNNLGVQREYFVGKIDRSTPPMSYNIMMNYLPQCDYGDSVAKAMIDLAHQYSDENIIKAINIGKQNNVYSIPYIKAVLEREQAIANMKKQEMERLAIRTESASEILNNQKVENTVADVASASYNWDKAKEDAELMAKFNSMFGGE